MVVKNCHRCDNTTSKKCKIIITYPQVLLLQYKCFTNIESNIANQIICGASLKLYNATYKLTGIVVHIGTSMMAGYYYAITCCWETGKAYKLNDAQDLITLQYKEIDEEIKNVIC